MHIYDSIEKNRNQVATNLQEGVALWSRSAHPGRIDRWPALARDSKRSVVGCGSPICSAYLYAGGISTNHGIDMLSQVATVMKLNPWVCVSMCFTRKFLYTKLGNLPSSRTLLINDRVANPYQQQTGSKSKARKTIQPPD